MTTSKSFFNANFTGVAFINNIALRKRNAGDDDSEFMTIELGVRKGEKKPGNFQTDRFSAIVVGNQAKKMCEAIMTVVDFSIDTIQRDSDSELGRPVVSCSFRAGNIRSSLYHKDEDVIHYLSGNILKLEHVYIGGELFTLDNDESIAELISTQSDAVRQEVDIFIASVVDKEEVILDASEPLLNEYVRALGEAGFKNAGNILHWTSQ